MSITCGRVQRLKRTITVFRRTPAIRNCQRLKRGLANGEADELFISVLTAPEAGGSVSHV